MRNRFKNSSFFESKQKNFAAPGENWCGRRRTSLSALTEDHEWNQGKPASVPLSLICNVKGARGPSR
jgi:hypothetical protein